MVVSTLTDAKKYTKEDLAELYHKRWLAELDIRAIKISLRMDVLRCKTPQMVRREIWICLLAYNLIRQTLLEAAKQSGCSPRQLSFTAAMQKIAASWGSLLAQGVTQINPIRVYWWLIAFPGAVLVITLLAINFIGDGLRDAWNVRDNR